MYDKIYIGQASEGNGTNCQGREQRSTVTGADYKTANDTAHKT